MKKAWGVRIRVLIVALIPPLILGVSLTLLLTSSRLTDIEESLIQRGKALSRQLAVTAEYGLSTNDRALLQQIANTAVLEEDLTGITIFDAQHTFMASAGLQAHTPLQFSPPGSHTHIERIDEHLLRISQRVLRSSRTIPSPSSAAQSGSTEALGEVVVLISLDSLTQRKNALIQTSLATLVIVMAATFLLAIKMSHSVTAPIRTIANIVTAIGQGDFSARVRVKGGGSLYTLAEGVNLMAKRLTLEREQLEQKIHDATLQLRRKKEEAEQANLAKSRFLAAASHDLRQPMHALGLLIAHLSEYQHADEVKQIIQKISASAQALEQLLESLLDISKLDAGVITAKVIAFPLQPIFTRLSVEFEAQAKEKGLRFLVRPTAAWVRSDPVLFERIIQNLISNALRYTKEGAVLLAARKRPQHVSIEVRDSGIGIPVEAQELVFQEFTQLENIARDRSKGLGLGLAIVKRLAALLEHPLKLRSRPNWGSIFALELPRCSPQQQHEVETIIPTEDFTNQVVGIIENDALAQEGLTGLLTKWGCRVIAAESMASFLNQLSAENILPNALLCDYRLATNYTGLDIIAHIRKHFGSSLPAVLMSGDTNPELLKKTQEQNIRLLHKPVRPAKLRTALRRLLIHHEGE